MTALTLLQPWLLLGLLILPVIWWLLRLTPPAPKHLQFPALLLLRDLAHPQQTPAHTPWWLLLLRLLAIACLIVALAHPVLNPETRLASDGPLTLVIDNDWAAARDWPLRQTKLDAVLDEVQRAQRPVTFLATTPAADGAPLQIQGPMDAASAAARLSVLQPLPWPADWQQAAKLLADLPQPEGSAIWLASGLGDQGAEQLADQLARFSETQIISDQERNPIYLLSGSGPETDQPSLTVMRATAISSDELGAVALAANGDTLAQFKISFSPGSTQTEQAIDIPMDVRNKIARFELVGVRTAATLMLMDERWRRRNVGIIGDADESIRQSLLSPLFYLERALKPYTALTTASFTSLIEQKPAVLLLTDQTTLTQQEIEQLASWVKAGGMLVRFAGPKLANSTNPLDRDLLPVALRTGDRALGGALSWSTPQSLQAIPATSPFADLTLPGDVTVNRQVLAEPAPDLAARTWLALSDGTPLITGKPYGQGTSVLFHVPATADWSNLPISGLFVDLLRRLVNLSQGNAISPTTEGNRALHRMLDAFGAFQTPSSYAKPLPQDISQLQVSPQHPPGYYGPEDAGLALNLGTTLPRPTLLQPALVTGSYALAQAALDLQPWLMMAAILLLLLDFIISLFLRGQLQFARTTSSQFTSKPIAKTFIILTFLTTLHVPPTLAAPTRNEATELTGRTQLAYVITGDTAIDQTSQAGLKALAMMLERRTSLSEPGVMGVALSRDELAFYPLLYWPLTANATPLDQAAIKNVNHYLQHGGMILFDTREGQDQGTLNVQRILTGLQLPPLIQLPQQHVLKRSFYLLEDWPGRFTGSTLWIEPAQNSAFDGVASILIGSHDWAGAWALDPRGEPQFAAVPGGETQREFAYRFGVNLVMYALTGNYKEDQLHAKALLERGIQ